MKCPRCQSENIIRNGSIHNGKQKYECKECRRQFVENPQNKIISSEIKVLIDRLLCEKIPSAGICRVTGVSEKRLQDYVNGKYGAVPRQVHGCSILFNALIIQNIYEIDTVRIKFVSDIGYFVCS